MSDSANTVLRVFFIVTFIFNGVAVQGQTVPTASTKDALVVSLKMQAEQVRVGQMPWAILTVYNMSDQPVTLWNDSVSYRVYVYGKDGEAATTLVQREFTGRLRPGDVPLPEGPNAEPRPLLWPDGWPGDSYVRKVDLAYLYDLSVPGKYTAYAEVMDPVSHRWLRSKTVTFEMTTQ